MCDCFTRLLLIRQTDGCSVEEVNRRAKKVKSILKAQPHFQTRIRSLINKAQEHIIWTIEKKGRQPTGRHNCEAAQLIIEQLKISNTPKSPTPNSLAASTPQPTVSVPRTDEEDTTQVEDWSFISEQSQPIVAEPDVQPTEPETEEIGEEGPQPTDNKENKEPQTSETEPSHGEKDTFRWNVDYIISHHFRKNRDGDHITFKVQWEGFEIQNEEPLESAIKAKLAMASYLKGLSTRARNTLLKRAPQLGMAFKTQ